MIASCLSTFTPRPSSRFSPVLHPSNCLFQVTFNTSHCTRPCVSYFLWLFIFMLATLGHGMYKHLQRGARRPSTITRVREV